MATQLHTKPIEVPVDETGKPTVSTPPSYPLPSQLNIPVYEASEPEELPPYVNPTPPPEPIE